MVLRPYPKVPRERTDDPTGGRWVALEKVHGAQLAVAVGEDRRARFAKRKAWLSDEEPFFGWRLLAADVAVRVEALAAEFDAAQVVVYGELCGGGYPHPDVPAVPGLSPVQVGVFYAPDLRWLPFDVLVASHDDDCGDLLAWSDAAERLAAVGLDTPPILAAGDRARMAQLPMPFESRVPALFSLPPLADNVAEGVVARPDRRQRAPSRPAYKRKLPRFDDAAYLDAVPFDPPLLSTRELLGWGQRLVGSARWQSARSKVGEEREAIIAEFVLDVAIDLEAVFPSSWASCEQHAVLAGIEVVARALPGD